MNAFRLPVCVLSILLVAAISPAQTAPDPAPQATPKPEARRPERRVETRRELARNHEPVPLSAYNDHPRLAIILVIDQFRADYLERWRADFKNRGFDLFLEHGAYFPDCYYDYANLKTAPGHAAIGTGAYTDGNGISSNEWWDLRRNQQRPVSSVEDERYKLVGLPASSIPADMPGAAANAAKYVTGSSPRNLLASTVGDELRLATEGQAKVFGISLKDRAAILPAGAAANGAFWIDPASGYWVTSSFYMKQLPDWANAFNTGPAISQAEQEAGLIPPPASVSPNSTTAPASPTPPTASAAPTPPTAPAAPTTAPASPPQTTTATPPTATPSTAPAPQATGATPAAPSTPPTNVTNFFEQVGRTPAANDYELNFAEALIQGEQLGQGNVTDMLTISLSANDILGHQVGPDSPQEEQMVDSLDTQLDAFFTWLDNNIPGGLGNVWIALTADHGVAPVPATAAQYGLNAATIDVDKLIAALNYAINMKFSPGEKLQYILPHQELPYLSLNEPQFMKAGINEQEAEQAVQQALPAAVASLGPRTPEPPPSDSPVAGSGQPALQPSDTRLPPRPVLFRSYTREQLADGPYPPTPWGEMLAHSYSRNGGWYIMVIPAAFQMGLTRGTNHFTPWSYDRHVPLGLYGAPFAPGIYHGRVEPVDIAATFASLLGINQPSASVGHILTQALKPAAEVTYPRIVPPRVHHPPAAEHKARETHVPPTPGTTAPAQPPTTLQ